MLRSDEAALARLVDSVERASLRMLVINSMSFRFATRSVQYINALPWIQHTSTHLLFRLPTGYIYTAAVHSL